MPDLNRLKSLLGDDDAMLDRFIGMLRTEIPQHSAALTKQAQSGDWNSVSTTAHTLKGYLKYLSEEELAEIARQIETAAEKGPVPGHLIPALADGLALLLHGL